MKIFDEASVDCPPVRVTPLDRDDKGRELLERLEELQQQLADANHRAATASRPLPDLLARADELAAQSMAGRASAEEAEAAEEQVREAQNNVEAARREARQCAQAITLVEEQLAERARALYRENTRHVQSAHKELVQATLDAQKRASTLLRILREFEMRYARYTDSTEPEPYPRYLRDEERTRPPRSIMGPSQSPSGHVYAAGDATEWMQRASQLLGVDGPAIVNVETLDFESDDASLSLDDCRPLDATPPPPPVARGPSAKPSSVPPPSATASSATASSATASPAKAQSGAPRPADAPPKTQPETQPETQVSDPGDHGTDQGRDEADSHSEHEEHESAGAHQNTEGDVPANETSPEEAGDTAPSSDMEPTVPPEDAEMDPAERSHRSANE